MTTKQRAAAKGFTLTELLVVIGVGSVLAGVLLADLTQARSKLLQQACAANLRQWAMAIDLYTKDFDGAYFLSHATDSFDDAGSTFTNRYWPYLGGGNYIGTVRNMRICPAVAVRFTQSQIVSGTIHSYSMTIPQARYGGPPFYRNVDVPGSPWYNPADGSVWPTLRYLPNPSQFLLLIESSGHTLHCGGVQNAVTTTIQGLDADQIPATNRHAGAVNCLFGDFHVELVSYQTITNLAAIGCSRTIGNPWFNMN